MPLFQHGLKNCSFSTTAIDSVQKGLPAVKQPRRRQLAEAVQGYHLRCAVSRR